jgi:6-phosphogluconolactonase (cycloisomerase 2 family)
VIRESGLSFLDCTARPTAEAGRAIMAHYNGCPAGSRFRVRIDEYSAGLRVWLLEAGARHDSERLRDGWLLDIERARSPAQGTIPGVHHVIARGGFVWTCERAQRVARLEAGSGRVAACRAAARRASHLAIEAAAKRLFVADSEANAMIALDAGDLSEIARWDAPGGPQLPLVSPEGIVCVTGGATGTLTIARPAGHGYRAQTVEVGACPHDSALSADGQHVFVPCAGAAELVKVRLSDGGIVGRCATGSGPSHLAVHPDGSRIYSANSWDGTVSCVSADGEPVAQAASGGWAHAIDIAPDGRTVWVGNFLEDTLAVFDAVTLERRALLPTEPYAHGLDVSPDGRHVVATGFSSDCARIYDATLLREIARVEVGRGSSHTAFAEGAAFIGCSVADHVARVDLAACRRTGVLSLNQ